MTSLTKEELEHIREGWRFEAKLARGRHGDGEIPDALWETYSAFANTEGGYILLGAKELPDGELRFDGIPAIDKVERQLWNHLNNPQVVSANLLTSRDVQQLQINTNNLLLIFVPKASPSQRPISIKNDRYKVYLRVHEGDRLVDKARVDRMYAEQVVGYDASPIQELTLSDLNPPTIHQYRLIFASRRPEHPFNQSADDESFLRQIGALGLDRQTQRLHPNWAGLWMFGKESSIYDFFPKWHLDYQEHDSSDQGRWRDRIAPDGHWQPNLFEFYLRVIRKLHEDLKVPFELERDGHRNVISPAHEALREALINTLIHADLRGASGIKIEKSPQRFRFINPGLLLISKEQLWQGGISAPRNPTLHRLFGHLLLSERAGSGGPAMQQAWRKQHWRAPYIEEDIEHDLTTLVMSKESLFPSQTIDQLVERFGERFLQQNELGRIILANAQAHESVSHAQIQNLCQDHSRDITLKLQELVRLGLLEAEGKTRGMTYTLTRSHTSSVDSSSPNVDSSSPNVDSSSPNVDSSSPNVDSPSALEQLKQKGRASQELVERAILELCDEFRTSEEISEALGRAHSTVKNHYLPHLIKSGRLKLKHPTKPSHPQQAYKRA